jgi:hypothetical protein
MVVDGPRLLFNAAVERRHPEALAAVLNRQAAR